MNARTIETVRLHIDSYGIDEETGLVFTDVRGGPIRANRFSEEWRSTIHKLDGIEARGPHQLRHAYASMLIRFGESVSVVQKRLGHASARETLDTYAHLWPDSADRTRAAIDQAWSDVPDGVQMGSNQFQN